MASDPLARRIAHYGDDPELCSILGQVCELTRMGFAAIAFVNEDRWIACQVLDQIEFGLTPGGELDVSTTICADIRDSGRRIIIDHVREEKEWCTHPTPILFGFQSYLSLPLFVGDDQFFGTLCAIDPTPRLLNTPELIEAIERLARRVEEILRVRIAAADVGEARQA
jgi:GAF domain-containing protein